MSVSHLEKLLILTKTYPAPSVKYQELSCVAAIDQNFKMTRLYPIPYRLLEDKLQFQKWQWIQANVIPARNDNRPESFNIDVDSIIQLDIVKPKNNWAERLSIIKDQIVPDFTSLENRRQKTGQTLGFIRPDHFSLIISPSKSPDWSPEELKKLSQKQMNLFQTEETKNRPMLKKVPYDFYYQYTCSTDPSKQYKHKITDWEAGALYWNCFYRYGQNWEKYFRLKLEDQFVQERDLIFLMGTMHRFPDQWLIVGLVYPPKVTARQQTFLFHP